MKFHRIILGLCVFLMILALALSVSAQAAPPDESPTPESTVEIVADATEEATEIVVAPVVDATAEPVPDAPIVEEPDVTIINNNGFSFQEVLVLIFGFVLTIFAGARMFLMPALKANAELAKAAGTYVPQQSFDQAIGVLQGLQQWALTLTPNWKGDDEGLAKLRSEFEDWKNLLHPTDDGSVG
jgi:hypothetical protein